MRRILRGIPVVVTIAFLVTWHPQAFTQSPGTPAESAPVLPPVVVTELKALEETYALLDAVAQKAWPGWIGYREVPFLFEFENNLRVLIGHPNPPSPFQLVPGLSVGPHAVAADVSKVTSLELRPFFSGGGGPNNFGTTTDGKPVFTVHINLRGARTGETRKADADAPPARTEEKILIYLHELFHCYQQGAIRMQYGNLQYNPDAEFAAWSQIEGMALERAYREPDPQKARARVEEFLVARSLKRKSMTEQQQAEESCDDVREGTATYVMLRALEIVRDGGFKPRLSTTEDPYYHGFSEATRMIEEYVKRLATTAARHPDPKMKCYDYGSFQCALAERHVPGWQKMVEKGTPIDAVLAGAFPVPEGRRAGVERRLRAEYPYRAALTSARQFTEPRDKAYRDITTRHGRTYIINLKSVRLFTNALVPEAAAYRLGLLSLYPSGYPGFTVDAIEMSPVAVPMNADQLYYLRIVDTEWKQRSEAFKVTGTRQEDGSYIDAVVTTPLFTLKAPRLRLRESGSRVIIQVVARTR